MNKNLKYQLSELMHEIMTENKEIIANGDYQNLLSLCEQDISTLAYLDGDDNLTAKEISRRMNAPKTTVVTAVNRLEKRGYLIRVRNEKDRREMFLQLTAKGKKANQEHFEYEDLILNSLTKRWNESDQEMLAEILERREKSE